MFSYSSVVTTGCVLIIFNYYFFLELINCTVKGSNRLYEKYMVIIMALLEIATLIMAGVGLADYRHTKIYNDNLEQLKRKYGEHPDIDEAFEDICTLGGEYFEMPRLDLESRHPGIKMGSFYEYGANGPAKVLNEFFVTREERHYFFEKYKIEFEKQVQMRYDALEKMYQTIEPLYRVGAFESIGTERMDSRIFTSSLGVAKNEYHYGEMLQEVCDNTLWGEIIEAGPDISGGEYEYSSKWLIKEEVFNKIIYKEAYDILFESSWFYVNNKFW